MNTAWSEGRGWGREATDAYGTTFYKRAVGEYPEMESSRAAAKILAGWVRNGSSILDVGCGAGHYLRSFQAHIPRPFAYTGVDVTPEYIELGRKAFEGQVGVSFDVADIHALPYPDRTFDIVTCNNVLLHLPAFAPAMSELCRVARERVLVRTLVGERTFRIQEVRGEGNEIAPDGTPVGFNWYNIYSRPYVEQTTQALPGVTEVEVAEDRDFDPARIDAARAEQPSARNVTRMLGGWQVNGYILQPWAFIRVTKSER